MNREKAFTLIELLVVIAITALLLAVVMPALRLAKEKARNLSCRANVRSLALSLRVYSEQTDGKMFNYENDVLYLNRLVDQIGELDKVRQCSSTNLSELTSDSYQLGTSRTTWIWKDGAEPEHGSYGLNGWIYGSLSGSFVSQTLFKKQSYSNVLHAKNSASVPVFYDSVWVDAWPLDTDTVPVNFDLDLGDRGSHGPINHMHRALINRQKSLLTNCPILVETVQSVGRNVISLDDCQRLYRLHFVISILHCP